MKILAITCLSLAFCESLYSQYTNRENGLELIAYHLDTCFDETHWITSFACYLKNCSETEITVLLGSSPRESIRSRENLIAYWISLNEGEIVGELVKPPLSDLYPVTLKPGEITKLPECIWEPTDDKTRSLQVRVSYVVDENILKFYDVWTGRISIKIPKDVVKWGNTFYDFENQ